MKSKLITLTCVLALGLAGTTQAFAGNSSSASGAAPEAIMLDVALVRPACFVSTVVGSIFFVVGLPFAAISKSIKPTADALIGRPARATFSRPMGDLDDLADY